jgi:hypothetical protein
MEQLSSVAPAPYCLELDNLYCSLQRSATEGPTPHLSPQLAPGDEVVSTTSDSDTDAIHNKTHRASTVTSSSSRRCVGASAAASSSLRSSNVAVNSSYYSRDAALSKGPFQQQPACVASQGHAQGARGVSAAALISSKHTSAAAIASNSSAMVIKTSRDRCGMAAAVGPGMPQPESCGSLSRTTSAVDAGQPLGWPCQAPIQALMTLKSTRAALVELHLIAVLLWD